MTTTDAAKHKQVAALFRELQKPLPKPKIQRTKDLFRELGDRPYVIAIDNSGSMQGSAREKALAALAIRMERLPQAILLVSYETHMIARLEDSVLNQISIGPMAMEDLTEVLRMRQAMGPCNLEMLAEYMREQFSEDTIVVFVSDGQMAFDVEFSHDLYLYSTDPDTPPPLPYNPYVPWFKKSFATEKLKI